MILALIDERLAVVCLWGSCCPPPPLLPLALDSRGTWIRLASVPAKLGATIDELELAEPEPMDLSPIRPQPHRAEQAVAVSPVPVPDLDQVHLTAQLRPAAGVTPLVASVRVAQTMDPQQNEQDPDKQQQRLEQRGGHGVPIVAPQRATE